MVQVNVIEAYHLRTPSRTNRITRAIAEWVFDTFTPCCGGNEGFVSDLMDREILLDAVQTDELKLSKHQATLHEVHESYITDLLPGCQHLNPDLFEEDDDDEMVMDGEEEDSLPPKTKEQATLEEAYTPDQLYTKEEQLFDELLTSEQKYAEVDMKISSKLIASVRIAVIAKHGNHLAYTEENEKLVEKYALKIMRDEHFRNNVISAHLTYIVKSYFECRSNQVKAAERGRKAPRWLLKLLGFRYTGEAHRC
jgi:hypothetical protein